MHLPQSLALLDSGQYELAIASLDRMANTFPDRGEVYFFRALAHRALADEQRASVDYAKARQLPCEGPLADLKDQLRWHASSATSLFNRGCACHNEHDLERAINNYSAALKLDAGLAIALLNRGLAYQARDRNNPASGTYDDRHGGVPDCRRAERDFAAVLRLGTSARIAAIARSRLALLGKAG